ncbi:MAG: hypothetical protein ACI88A_003640 [Paraglaciecola sp.]|jgi:hypothetical protein
MIMFGTIGCLVLGVIFFAMRVQSVQSELRQAKLELKALQSHGRRVD